MPRVDACLLGAGMYPGYEQYWTGIQNEPDKPLPTTGALPTSDEIAYARFAARTPHYVLSSTLTSFGWPKTSSVRGFEEVAALKQRPGRDIYLVGGARTTASLIDAGLVDELRLIVYPVIAGTGKALFTATGERSSTRTTARGAASRRPGQPDLRNRLTALARPASTALTGDVWGTACAK